MTENPTKRNSWKLAAWTLAALLVLSVAALVCLQAVRQNNGNRAFATVPDNIVTADEEKRTEWADPENVSNRIGRRNGKTASFYIQNRIFLPALHAAASRAETKEVTIRLNKRNPDDNVPFHVANMFPGDSETKNFCVEVSYQNEVTVHFRAAVRPGYEKLAEVLMCRVVINDTLTLYDGTMEEMPQSLDYTLLSPEGTTEELYYTITAYLDTAVGNEYQNKTLIADFTWWVGSQGGSGNPGEEEKPGEQPGEDDDRENLIDPPYTGDDNALLLWIVILCVSAVVMVFLIAAWKKESRNERE